MQRQDSTYDQMKTVYDLAVKAGCYDAADQIKTILIDPIAKKVTEIVREEPKVQASFKYFADKYGWDNVCEVLGWSIYWAQEGSGNSDELISLSESQIKQLEGK
jgi:hypothetical protein